ncbi:MAG: 3-phosphoshikimate 1-carboxyvinyltransferase [Candidatus Hydrogenedentota bacterium]
MKSWRVSPLNGPLRGTIRVPGDKSISHRAIMLNALAGNREGSGITGLLESEDVIATRRVVRATLGASHADESGPILCDCGNSGTTMRLMMGALSSWRGPDGGSAPDVILDGDESLRRRPMERVAKHLRTMGASIETTANKPPVKVSGRRLQGRDITIDVASAQVKSALLLAGLAATGRTTVRMPAASRDHTERMLRHFGCPVTEENSGRIVAVEGGATLRSRPVDVPGDISSAAFFLVAAMAAREADVTIENVGVNPLRTGILDVMNSAGARLECGSPRVESGEPRADLQVARAKWGALTIAGDDIPRLIDEIPVLSLAAALADTDESIVRDAAELRVKETDRIDAIVGEFASIGLTAKPTPDGLIIPGRQSVRGGRVQSRGDHRIAMTAAVAGLLSRDGVVVENVECVETSFPGFVRLMCSLGAEIAEF